jgi:DNA modification methylase
MADIVFIRFGRGDAAVVYSEPRQKSSLLREDAIMETSISVEDIIRKITTLPYDLSIPQERLDLANKFRTSLFPWRGQFSPELVEILLDRYSQSGDMVLDPFVGSGTTLLESVRKNLRCCGVEINPSAVEMARTAQFANVTLADRKALIRDVEAFVEKHLLPFSKDLFSYQLENHNKDAQEFNNSQEEIFRRLIQEASGNSLTQNFISNVIIRYMNYREPRTYTDFFRAIREHAKIIENITYSKEECKVFHCDARSIPLTSNSVDLIVTSPPYINVFNYHQNNRPAMELVGWDLLSIAKSEIGSNRKNRQNRFLTVIQYAFDMLDVLTEMRRLLRSSGRAIVVVGRESKVRGVSFKNGVLVAALALGGAGFRLEALQERKFLNKFGETIYEDILHLKPNLDDDIRIANIAQAVAIWSLDQANISDEQVKTEISDARQRVSTVQKSPLFDISIAPYHSIDLISDNQVIGENSIGLTSDSQATGEKGVSMLAYPTPHLEKLEATLTNDKLPKGDKPQIEKAIQNYKQ